MTGHEDGDQTTVGFNRENAQSQPDANQRAKLIIIPIVLLCRWRSECAAQSAAKVGELEGLRRFVERQFRSRRSLLVLAISVHDIWSIWNIPLSHSKDCRMLRLLSRGVWGAAAPAARGKVAARTRLTLSSPSRLDVIKVAVISVNYCLITYTSLF